jgi:hypothetical protein
MQLLFDYVIVLLACLLDNIEGVPPTLHIGARLLFNMLNKKIDPERI